MNHNFDIFVKDHLQEILCEAEKELALAFIRKVRIISHKQAQLKLTNQFEVSEVPLQDCAVSPSFSKSHL
jgi:hypothetical protein